MRRWVRAAVVGPVEPATWWSLGAVTLALALLLGTGALVRMPLQVPDERVHMDLVVAVMAGGGFPDAGSRSLSPEVEGVVELLRRPTKMVDNALPGGATFDDAEPACSYETSQCTRSPRLEELRDWGADDPDFTTMRNSATQHPPLYYATTAALTTVVTGMLPMAIPIDLLLFTMRWLTLIWAIPLPFLAFAMARQFGRSEPGAVTAAAMCLVSAPLTVRSGPMVNNDTLTFLLAAIALLVATMVARRRPGSIGGMAVLGGVLGLGVLTKGLLLPFPILLLLVPVWGMRVDGVRWAVAVRQVAVGVGAWIAAGGWWAVRNVLVVNTLQPRVTRVSREPVTGTPDLGHWIVAWPTGTWREFWGGWLAWTRSGWIVVALVVVAVLVAVGWRRLDDRGLFLVILVAPLGTMAGVAAKSLQVYHLHGGIAGVHGRYTLVGLTMLAVVLAAGLRAWRDPRARAVSSSLAIVVLAALQVHALAGVLDLWGLDRLGLVASYRISRAWSPIGSLGHDAWMLVAAVGLGACIAWVVRHLWVSGSREVGRPTLPRAGRSAT